MGPPVNETVLMGARDGFVESLRTNTSLVRRHIKAPELKIREQIVGRQSLTSVDIVLAGRDRRPGDRGRGGAANGPDRHRCRALPREIWRNIRWMMLPPAFPLIQYTERPDRFCGGPGGKAGRVS